MVMPLADLRAIYELLFRDGVMVAKKDNRPQCMHPNLEGIANLKVIRVMGSLKSRGFVRETFAWKHAYYYLTNEGIVYLREYLHLPPEIVPSSLQRVRRPAFTLDVMRRANRVGSQTVEGPTSYVPKPRAGVGESQEGMMDRQRYRHKRPGEEEEESDKPPMRFRGSYQSRAPPGEPGAQTQTFFRRGQGLRRGEERVAEEGQRRGFRGSQFSSESRNAAPVREPKPPTSRVPMIPKEVPAALPVVQQVTEPTLPPAFIPAVEQTPEVPVTAPIIPEVPEEVPMAPHHVIEPELAPVVTPAEEPIPEVAASMPEISEEVSAVHQVVEPVIIPADSEEPISEVPVVTSSTPEIPADELASEVPVEAPSPPEIPEEVPQDLSVVEPEVEPEVPAPSVEEVVEEAVEEEIVQEVISAEPPEVTEEPVEPEETVLEEEGAVTQVPSEELNQDVLEDGKEEEEEDEEDDEDEEEEEEDEEEDDDEEDEPTPVLQEPAEVTEEIVTEVKPDEPVEEDSQPAPLVEEPKVEEQDVLVTEAVSSEDTPDVPVEVSYDAEIDILEEPKELVDNVLETHVPAAKAETPESDSDYELPSPPSPVADDFTNLSEETGVSHNTVCPERSSMQITQETVTVEEEPNVTQVISQSHTYVQMSSSSVMVSNMVPELGLEQEKTEAFEAHFASPFVSSDSPIAVLKSNLPHGDWGFLTEDPNDEQEVKKVWPDSLEG